MKVNVVHADLNPCGGAEQVAIATLQALIEMDLDIELTTARRPNIQRLGNAFGVRRIDTIFSRIKRTSLLHELPLTTKYYDNATNAAAPAEGDDSDDGGSGGRDGNTFTINTHGDALAYHLPHFSRSNAITYCHYPLVTEFAREHNAGYLKYLKGLGLVKLNEDENNDDDDGRPDNNNNNSNNVLAFHTKNDNSHFWHALYESSVMMLKHSTVVTNSSFSKGAIVKTMLSSASCNNNTNDGGKKKATTTATDSCIPTREPIVIPPPVNVREFREAALYSDERDDLIVVISRFNPNKNLERAIALAHMLKNHGIGKGMMMVGGLMPEDRNYYDRIVSMIKNCGLSDYVTIQANITSDTLKSILRRGKVYFHPMSGEPFGISIAEAMSAGLIPIVPSNGGHTDFVGQEYRFSSLEDAVEKISSSLNASKEERNALSNMVAPFSTENYIRSIQKLIKNMMNKSSQEVSAMKLAPLVESGPHTRSKNMLPVSSDSW